MAASFKGLRRFVILGKPWMDDTNSFWMANVEVRDASEEPQLPDSLAEQTQKLHDDIPKLVHQWTAALLENNVATPAIMHALMGELGKLPSSFDGRAMWVASMLNPVFPLRMCVEIRPAMLACRNDHDRLILATTALHSSMDHVTGKQKLF